MKTYSLLPIMMLALVITACSQSNKIIEPLQFRGFKIGDKVDTALYKKIGDLSYFPNYLDGNADELPSQYKGLPIATWQSKKDSSIMLTLLKDIVFKIIISYLSDEEKNQIPKTLTEKFGFDGVNKSYQEKHPLQSYIAFWDLKTWETKDVIVQIGNGDLRLPDEPKPIKATWNLVYTDLLLEKKIITDFKSKQ